MNLVVKPFINLGVITTPRDERLIEQALSKGDSLYCKACGGCKFNVQGITLSKMKVSFNGKPVVYKVEKEETRLTRLLDCASCGGTEIEAKETAST